MNTKDFRRSEGFSFITNQPVEFYEMRPRIFERSGAIAWRSFEAALSRAKAAFVDRFP